MAICIDGNFVCLGGGCFCQTPTGIEFSGEAVAEIFCDARAYGGTVAGFAVNGRTNPQFAVQNFIGRFPFTSDTNATDVGESFQATRYSTSSSSLTHGYQAAGYVFPNDINTIQKFPFSVSTSGSDVGELAGTYLACSGGFTSRLDGNGYNVGGACTDAIEKYPFSTDSPASDVGQLATAQRYAFGSSSSLTHGYISGGVSCDNPGDCLFNSTIDKFAFSNDTPVGCVGNIGEERRHPVGHSSPTHGYITGGVAGCPTNNPPVIPTLQREDIRKFPFAGEGAATDVGELGFCGLYHNNFSTDSTTDGYNNQGSINKFSFSSDVSASCIGSIPCGTAGAIGNQH